MSTKRMLVITALVVIFIAAVVSVMLFFSFSGHDDRSVALPEPQVSPEPPASSSPDMLDRVEVTKDTVQAVVSTLSRPDSYFRSIVVESFWDGGHAVYNIAVSVVGGATALRVSQSAGPDKRILVTQDKLYIWYSGDRAPFVGSASSESDLTRSSDEWQMLVSYEDLLELDTGDIIEAGYVAYGDVYCVYANTRAPLPGYTRKYYIPIGLGLLTDVEEYDESGNMVYSMTTGECVVGEVDASAFILPDGTNILA